MIEVCVAGLGTWSDRFADCEELALGLRDGVWADQPALSPSVMPPRERRRAPQTVKMAMESMSQALADAQSRAVFSTDQTAVVTASSMGDMKITDTMCRTVTTHPRLVSPTTFHNSVHNAAVGYWSISQQSHASCNAVAAGEFSGPAGLLEAAVLCVDEKRPVLVVVQEGAAPPTLYPLCRSSHALSLAFMLLPAAESDKNPNLPRLKMQVDQATCDWPTLPETLQESFGESPAGRILLLFIGLMKQFDPTASSETITLPLSPHARLSLSLGSPGEQSP